MPHPVRVGAILLSSLAAFALVACAATPAVPAPTRPTAVPAGWTYFAAKQAFAFWGPSDLKEEKVQGIDSYVGRYTSPTLKVQFDYGRYSGPSEGERFKQEALTVDGRKAFLYTWDSGVRLFVPDVGDPPKPDDGTPWSRTNLSMSVTCKPADAPRATLLLRSITFGSSLARDGDQASVAPASPRQ